MKKRIAASLLAITLLFTDSSIVFAAGTAGIDTGNALVKEAAEQTETDKQDEQEPVIELRSVQGDFEYTVSGEAATITKYTGTGGTVTIPEAIDGVPVTGIGVSAFDGCSVLERIVIPDSVTRIERDAFRNASALSEVRLSGSLTYLGGQAFDGCENLTEIEIPASLEEADYYFGGPFIRSGLKTVTFEEGTTGSRGGCLTAAVRWRRSSCRRA